MESEQFSEMEGPGRDRYYNSIEDIFQDMTQAEDVGLPWVYFIKLYENAFETVRIDIHSNLPGMDALKSDRPEYYDAVLKFEEEANAALGPAMSPELYNKLITLSMLTQKVAEFVTSPKCRKELKSFKDSIMFLHKAKAHTKPPLEFYTAMAVIFLWEDLKIKYEYRKKSAKDKEKAKLEVKMWMDVLRMFFLKKVVEIVNMIYRKGERPVIQTMIKVNPTDVYFHIRKNGTMSPYAMKFFDDEGRAMTIILTGDKRSGKTIGWLKIIESALNQGYTVFIFGKDTRLELRWANFPISKSVESLYDLVVGQGQMPRGLPIKIYTDNPEYPIERDASKFGRTSYQWNRITGVNVFESDLLRIMKSFGRWRSRDKSKKIVAMFNEMHEFIPATPRKGEWEFVQEVKRMFTHIGGWRCPVVGTTQYVNKIDANARQIDVIISSYLTNLKDRKAIANIANDRRYAVWLGDQTLKPNNYFWMFHENRAAKIRFILPRCMPESSTERTLDELFAEVSPNGPDKGENEGEGGSDV